MTKRKYLSKEEFIAGRPPEAALLRGHALSTFVKRVLVEKDSGEPESTSFLISVKSYSSACRAYTKAQRVSDATALALEQQIAALQIQVDKMTAEREMVWETADRIDAELKKIQAAGKGLGASLRRVGKAYPDQPLNDMFKVIHALPMNRQVKPPFVRPVRRKP